MQASHYEALGEADVIESVPLFVLGVTADSSSISSEEKAMALQASVCPKCFTDLFFSHGVRMLTCEITTYSSIYTDPFNSFVFRHFDHPVEIEIDACAESGASVTGAGYVKLLPTSPCQCRLPNVEYELLLKAAVVAKWPLRDSFPSARLYLMTKSDLQREAHRLNVDSHFAAYTDMSSSAYSAARNPDGSMKPSASLPCSKVPPAQVPPDFKTPVLLPRERWYVIWNNWPKHPADGESQILVSRKVCL